MSAQLRASAGRLDLQGLVLSPDGDEKARIALTSDVPSQTGLLARLARFLPNWFPFELSHSTSARNAMCNAVVDLFDAGSLNSAGQIRIYTAGKVTRLAEIFMVNPAFGDAVNGVAIGQSLPWSDADADGDGDAALFEIRDRDLNVIINGDVALAGADMSFNQVGIQIDDVVKILSASYTAAP